MTVLDLLLGGATLPELMAHPEVNEHCLRMEEEDVELHQALKMYSWMEGQVVITDFRGLERVPVGNRFLVFALFPEGNVALRVQKREGRAHPMLTMGHSIITRTRPTVSDSGPKVS